ncbi:MAG: MopE-related protein [Polyangiales bacterium]
MTRPRFPYAFALLALAACTSRGIAGGPVTGDDAGDVEDVAVSPDVPVTPDVPVAPDLPVTPDVPVTPDRPPPMDVCVPQAESSAAACSNGRDDDCDGTVDCRDLGCATYCVDAGPDVMCTPRGPENTNAACGNGVDDDCDGYVDCGGASGTLPDFDCTMNAAVTVCPRDGGVTPDVACTPRGTEDNNAACSNGVDDDCDGYIDCGGATSPDFGCTMNAAVTVCPRDGGVTPDRPPCTPTGRESASACGDGVDNDCNGYTDCDDRSCSCTGACRPFRMGCVCSGAEATNATCGDAVDNDCDGFIDCVDFDCTLSSTVTLCPRDAGRD